MNTKFHKPRTLADALAMLADDPEARPLSGGQTLVPMLNLRVIQPSAIISLNALDELRGIVREPTGAVRIGARATATEIASSTLFTAGQRLLPGTAAQIAYPAIRNAGTIGGACAHGDPVADWPPALTAASAQLEISSTAGKRMVEADDFFLDFLTTALKPGELITAIVVPPLPGNGVYRKLSRVDGDYATVSVAAIVETKASAVTFARITVGSIGPRPLRIAAAEAGLIGTSLDAQAAARAGAALAAAADPHSDVRGSGHYRRRVLPRVVAQTLLDCGADA